MVLQQVNLLPFKELLQVYSTSQFHPDEFGIYSTPMQTRMLISVLLFFVYFVVDEVNWYFIEVQPFYQNIVKRVECSRPVKQESSLKYSNRLSTNVLPNLKFVKNPFLMCFMTLNERNTSYRSTNSWRWPLNLCWFGRFTHYFVGAAFV